MVLERLSRGLRRFKTRSWIALAVIVVMVITGVVVLRQNPSMAEAVTAKVASRISPNSAVTATQPQIPAIVPPAPVVPAPVAPVVELTSQWAAVLVRNVRPAPTTANVPLRQLGYRERILVKGQVKGQDPYGTGRPDWFELADGTFVWAQNMVPADPGPKPVTAAPTRVRLSTEATPLKQTEIRTRKTRTTAGRPGVVMPSGVNWAALRQCESSGNYRSRAPHGHYGAYQFDLPTWRSVGGRGNPADANPAEQDMRAKRLYAQRGLQPWECAWAARQ